MDSDRITRSLALLANLGVIVGLVFLAIELRQTSSIATADYRLVYAAGWRSVDESRQDEAFAKVLAKSIENPKELTLEEVIRLDAYYLGVIDQLLSAHTARETGLVEGGLDGVVNSVGAMYFSNEFARAWWKQVRPDWLKASEGEIVKILDQAVVAGELGRAQRIHEGIISELTQ